MVKLKPLRSIKTWIVKLILASVCKKHEQTFSFNMTNVIHINIFGMIYQTATCDAHFTASPCAFWWSPPHRILCQIISNHHLLEFKLKKRVVFFSCPKQCPARGLQFSSAGSLLERWRGRWVTKMRMWRWAMQTVYDGGCRLGLVAALWCSRWWCEPVAEEETAWQNCQKKNRNPLLTESLQILLQNEIFYLKN